jgi:translation initiation factor IF-1
LVRQELKTEHYQTETNTNGTREDMSKSDLIELSGTVDEVLPGSMYRVRIDKMPNSILCYTGGKLKQHKIKIILGDRVKVEVSPYDLTKGRVTYRL